MSWGQSPRQSDHRPDDRALDGDQLAYALLGEAEQGVEAGAIEGCCLGYSLDLDEPAAAGLDDVHIDFGAGILFVREIEHWRAGDDPDARRGNVVGDWHRLDRAGLLQFVERQHERDERTADRGGARAAVGLEDVAIEPDRPLAQLLELDDG